MSKAIRIITIVLAVLLGLVLTALGITQLAPCSAAAAAQAANIALAIPKPGE